MIVEREKGKSLKKFIDNYTSFDLETTDFNIYKAEIIEIGAIKIRNGEIVDTFQMLVKPKEPIPLEITEITGIDNDMVENAEKVGDALKKFIDFIGDDVLLGHNITTFDLNLIYDAALSQLGHKISNDFIDMLYLCRKILPNLPNYQLSTICDGLNVNTFGAHRALEDSKMAYRCFEMMKSNPEIDLSNVENCSNYHSVRYSENTKQLQVLSGFLEGILADNILTEEEIISLKKWVDNNKSLQGNYPFDIIFESLERVLEDGKIDEDEIDYLFELFNKIINPVKQISSTENIKLKDKHCVVTGEFEYGDRNRIREFIEMKGGIFDNNITKHTDYLIIGKKGSKEWSQGKYGTKIKKAIELNEKGCGIKLINEEDLTLNE